ncbi:MAG: fibrobacter succinogenes major paralogous domain-containing protein [Bacteroidales bacterium]|nr:fibrobacter succinogenes major paralogous domain-containing protein [Bacteroidales bacterium]
MKIKQTITLILFVLAGIVNLNGQDTLFIYKTGGAIIKKAVLDIDSITFYAVAMPIDTTIVKDIEGNVYKTVVIGEQTWMAENLRATKLNDGTELPRVTEGSDWYKLRTPAYCYWDNDSINYHNVFGPLYNWYTVNTGKLCPAGWHIPTDEEWTVMQNFLIANGYNFDGATTGNNISKALADTILWTASTVEGAIGNTDFPEFRNKSGFSALPGGYRNEGGNFIRALVRGYWWTSTPYSEDPESSWYRELRYDTTDVFVNVAKQWMGFSVRCIKD